MNIKPPQFKSKQDCCDFLALEYITPPRTIKLPEGVIDFLTDEELVIVSEDYNAEKAIRLISILHIYFPLTHKVIYLFGESHPLSDSLQFTCDALGIQIRYPGLPLDVW
jgi:hypothetical protein